MAYYYNYKFWLTTAEDINNLVLKIKAFKHTKPTQNKFMAHNIFSMIYSRYVTLVNRLSYLYDVTLQVQKRALIKRLLEAATGRLLDVRNELKQIELSEYIYLDDSFIKLKVVLDDVQLLRPFHFPMTRDPEIENLVNNKMTRKSTEEETSETSISVAAKIVPKLGQARQRVAKHIDIIEQLAQTDPVKYSRIIASNLIKVHEKARKGRTFLTNIRCQPEKYRPKAPTVGKGFYYEYTHKADQPMLILVRRTFYDSNYFFEREIADKVDYYVRPEHRTLKLRRKASIVSRTSEGESIDDDFIQFEEHFEEETAGSYVETIATSSWETRSMSVLKKFTGKLESMTSFGDLSRTALDIQQGVRARQALNASSKDYIRPVQTSVIMYKREMPSELSDSRKPSSITMTRPTKGITPSFSRDSLGISESDDVAASLRSALSKKLEESAATVIQMCWRRFLLQRRLERRRLRKLILYGMASEWRWDKKLNKDLDQERLKLRSKKTMFDKQFIEACQNEKTRILKVRGPWIMEDISEHIRAWFRKFYNGVGEFDRYPEEFEGGTILVIRGETMTVDEYRQAKEAKKKKKKKTPEQKKKEREARKAALEKKKEQKRKEKQLAKQQKLLEAKEGKTYDFSKESPFLTQMAEVMDEYETEWANIDERNNVNEDPYMEWISLDKFAEAHLELRVIVDELMRVEFELLRKALAQDQKKKYKPQKKKKQRKKKGKRGKRRKKQQKDLTADRSTESLYNELEAYGIIKKIQPTNLDDYIGEYNYSAYEKRIIYQMDPPPGQGEIKDLIREALIGMGPLNFPKAKSLLLAGPLNSGKNFLANAVVSEIGAIVLDISPEKVIPFEKNMKYFLHLINKMARILQPTVLFIADCERIFWKKVPKEEAHSKPHLLGKYIIKQIVKPIKKDEKLMLLGTSSEPFKAKLNKMKKCFEKVIVVPRADYGTTFQLHRGLALQKYGVPRDFEFSPISMVAKGYGSSIIYDNLNSTLGIERRMKFLRQPLKAHEIVEGFLNGNEPKFPITDDEFAKFTKFYTKVNKLAKQRDKYLKTQAKLNEKQKPKK